MSDFFRGKIVESQIAKINPHLVHVNQLQLAGYPTLRAFEKFQTQLPKLWVTNYGSELSWYLPRRLHSARLRRLLGIADYFSAECTRDYRLAEAAGFSGTALPCLPVSGSLVINPASQKTDARTRIAVKGYQTRWGMGLRAVYRSAKFARRFADAKKFELFVFSCTLPTFLYCWFLDQISHTPVKYFRKGKLSHEQVLMALAESVVYVGASKADGISTSMLEAMSQGAFPIQTNTSCAAEWFTTETGVAYPIEDVKLLDKILARVVFGDFDLDLARERNFSKLSNSLNPEVVNRAIWGFYDKVLC